MRALLILPLFSISKAFAPFTITQKPLKWQRSFLHSSSTDDGTSTAIKPCSYQDIDGKWKQRVLWDDIQVGQKLSGFVCSKLLDGQTGPKVFFECGLGRLDGKGNWQMVSGMLRLGTKYTKPSVIRKKVMKLTGKSIDLYVHRIFKDDCRLEVKLLEEGVEPDLSSEKSRNKLVPISSLKVGQELTGTVVQVRPYGCIVDVGANRHGLLHIQRVADLYQEYIDKEKGLEDAGLEKGFQIKLCVRSNEKKRLSLDFTKETKEYFEQEREEEEEEEKKTEPVEEESSTQDLELVSENNVEIDITQEEEAAAWAAYASDNEYDDEDESDDDYDEDREIESALGLDYY
jgi:predicted RNA-binding protein with RPS1 domain